LPFGVWLPLLCRVKMDRGERSAGPAASEAGRHRPRAAKIRMASRVRENSRALWPKIARPPLILD